MTTEPDLTEAMEVWRDAAGAYEDGTAEIVGQPMRDMVIAGDKAAARVIAAALEARDARIRELEGALEKALAFLRSAPLESGVCCCGSPVDEHGYGDGHSPVDDLAYHASNLADSFATILTKENTHD